MSKLINLNEIITEIQIKDKNNKVDDNSVINKILNLFKMNKIFFIIILLFGGIIGQVLTRIFFLDGSLDKWYLLIPPFTTFPISLYPGYLLYNSDIKNGAGGPPYDELILLPALVSGIMTLVIDSVLDKGIASAIFKFMINMLCIGYVLYHKDDKNCNLNTPHIDKIIVHSIIFVSLIPLMPMLFSYIPYFDKVIEKISGTSDYSEMFANVFIRFISIVFMYIMYNIYYGLDPRKSCAKNYNGKHHELIIYIIFGLVINIMIGKGKED